MKTFTKVLATLTLSLSVAGMANASILIAKDSSVSTELCMKAASSNKFALNKAIKSSGLSKSFVVNNIKCNEKNITEFVSQHGKSPVKMNALLNQGLKNVQVTINETASL